MSKNTDKGYIAINRGFFDHKFWNEKRVFSRSEAWLYLLKEAKFEDTRLYFGNRIVIVKRGDICVSLRFLCTAWGWGKHKVDNFLDFLLLDDMIKKGTDVGTGQTLITICNYEHYNKIKPSRGTAGGQQGDSRGTAGGQNINNISNLSNLTINDKSLIINKEFAKFKNWILKNAINVANMKEPFTESQFQNLEAQYGRERLKQIILSMHNRPEKIKNLCSANLTFIEWEERNRKFKQNEKSTRGNDYDRGREVTKAIDDKIAYNIEHGIDTTKRPDISGLL